MHKTRLEGDHQTLTFGVMQLFDVTQPDALRACQNRQEKGPIPGLKNKSWEFGGHE